MQILENINLVKSCACRSFLEETYKKALGGKYGLPSQSFWVSMGRSCKRYGDSFPNPFILFFKHTDTSALQALPSP